MNQEFFSCSSLQFFSALRSAKAGVNDDTKEEVLEDDDNESMTIRKKVRS